jgi:serine/threonine protein kinase
VGELADGRVYYVMKNVRGLRLDVWLLEPRDLSARLQLFLKICEAVSFAHAQGVMHRDLKPQNVMVGEFGEALVLDWGLAKGIALSQGGAVEGDALGTVRDAGGPLDATAHGTVLGTPRYMAPEQEAGDPTMDVRVDVYALGRILEDLTPGALPRPLRAIREKATAAARADRYAGAADMATDVNRFLSGLRVSAHAETPWESLGRHLDRHRTIVVLIAAYLVLRLLGLLLFRR